MIKANQKRLMNRKGKKTLLSAVRLHRHECWVQLDSNESREKKIIQIGTEINKIENKSKTERTNKAKTHLFETILKTFGETDQGKSKKDK